MRAKSSFLSLFHLFSVQIVSLLILFMSNSLSASQQARLSSPMPAPLSSASVASTMEQDARLKRPITIHAVGIALDDLLNRLSAKDLKLSTGRSSSSQKLQLRLTRKPLSVLMQSLAQLLGGNWKPNADGSGYFFSQSPETISRRERWWQLLLSDRERAKEAQRRFILQKMHTPPVRGRIFHGSTDPANEDTAEEDRDLLRQQFFRDLPPALQAQIARQMVDYAFQQGFGIGSTDEGAIAIPLTQLPERPQNTLWEENSRFTQYYHTRPEDVMIQFHNTGGSVHVSVVLLNTTPLRESESLTLGVGLCPDARTLPLDGQGLVKIVKELGKNAPATWKELAGYEASRVWPNSLPRQNPFDSATFPSPGKYRADVLDWLADQGGIDFVADYYTKPFKTPMTADQKARPLPADLKEELNVIAQQHDLSWCRTDVGIYLFRNNRWYRDDRLEVPAALLQRWLTQLEALQVRPAALPTGPKTDDPDRDLVHFKARMDLEADIVSHLTEWQIPVGFAWTAMERTVAFPTPDKAAGPSGVSAPTQVPPAKEVGFPFMAVAIRMMKELGTVRFYARLDETKREALLAGQLPLSALSPAQQDQILYLSPTLRYTVDNQNMKLGLQLQWAAGYLSAPGAIDPWSNIRLVAIPAR